MELSADFWALSGGTNAQWRAMLDLRADRALGELRALAAGLRRRQPRCWSELGLGRSFELILGCRHPARRKLLLFPAFDNWLFLSRQLAEGLRPEGEWESHLPFVQSFAAALAAEAGVGLELPVRLGPGGRFHATGTREYFHFPGALPGEAATVRARAGRLAALRKGRSARRALLPEIASGMWADFRDPLVLQPFYVHQPASLSPSEERRYVGSLAGAMAEIRRLDAPLHEEIRDFIRILVPLQNPQDHGSVSSSYATLRGALGLSHSDDGLLQQETLVHEFCHQKANLLAERDPLILPGQAGQVFYSPLRPDARRLRGLLLGAHAFVNVNRHLLRALEVRVSGPERRDSIARNILRRIWHVEDMLRSVSGYAELTSFGRDFLLRLWREAMLHHHAALAFPPSLVEEARLAHREHRGRFALGDTGVFRAAAA